MRVAAGSRGVDRLAGTDKSDQFMISQIDGKTTRHAGVWQGFQR